MAIRGCGTSSADWYQPLVVFWLLSEDAPAAVAARVVLFRRCVTPWTRKIIAPLVSPNDETRVHPEYLIAPDPFSESE